MGIDVFLVVEVFSNPNIGNGQLQCSISVRQNRDPLIGMHGCPIVEIRTNID
jgi:hypothetical protein